MRIFLALAAAAALLPLSANAQTTQRPADSTRRDPTNTLPLVTTRNVTFTTDQGTWMSVDVSPNGSTIVFDLLGDIYTMPISGGKATRIVGGNSIDMHPRFSPDAASIVFISDRGGADATWIADADGKRLRVLTQGGHYPAFTPDGKEIVTGNRLVDLRGGAGVSLPGFGTGASFTADGRYIWYQAGRQAARYDRNTGESSYRTNLPGGVLRPMVSRDGKSLAYFTRFETQMALVIRDLASGADRWVLMGTQPEAGTLPVAAAPPAPTPPPNAPAPPGGRGGGAQPSGVGPLPGSAWLANGSAIITSFGGKLWRVEVPSGTKTQIPFTADVQQSLGPLVKGSYEISDSVVVREIREPALSPDGERVAFTALGKVWVMDLDVRTPRRLTSASGTIEASPTWSPDGRSIAYATWVDGDGGDIHIVDANGGASRNLTRAPAMYTRLNFTPNGSRLVFARAPRHARTVTVDDDARTAELNLELRWMAATGGAQHPIIMVTDVGALPLGGFPHFTSDTTRVFLHDGTALVSLRWNGTDRKIVLAGATPQTLLAPDGIRVLSRAGRRNHIYMFERPNVTDSLAIDPTAGSPPVPVRRLTRAVGGGEFPSWSRDGSKAVWSSGATLHVYDVPRGDKATADSVAAALNRIGSAAPTADSTRRPPAAADSSTRSTAVYEATRHEIRISVAADKPTGVVALRGARIITMNAGEVIANGDIVITDNRITAVGARGKVTIPSGARIINVAGKTILPGYVDVHAQINTPSQIHRTMVPQYMANLAFGVTTTRDPESRDMDTFTYSDLVSAGDLLGPRIFATGPPVLDATASIANAAEGRTFMGPYATEYRTNTVRGDLTATRTARQRFLQVGKELGLTAVAMSSPDFKKSLSAILDGYADHQAAYEVFPLQDDVAKLIAESGLTYTPMLLGRVGARTGMHHILATENPHADPKVQRFYYHKDLDRLTRAGAAWTVAEEFPFKDIGAGAARIVAAGGKVALGSNGSVQGLGLHWEMWLLSKGGMPAHDILRAATLSGAEAIGVGSQLGSIQAGKLADLQVLDLNPLTNIRNTNSVRYVMKNGRLYDAATLDQISPTPVKLGKLWWLEQVPTGGER